MTLIINLVSCFYGYGYGCFALNSGCICFAVSFLLVYAFTVISALENWTSHVSAVQFLFFGILLLSSANTNTRIKLQGVHGFLNTEN